MEEGQTLVLFILQQAAFQRQFAFRQHIPFQYNISLQDRHEVTSVSITHAVCNFSNYCRFAGAVGNEAYKIPVHRNASSLHKSFADCSRRVLFCNIRGSSFSLIRCRSVNHFTTKKLQEQKGNPQGKAPLKPIPIIKELLHRRSQSGHQNTGKETYKI